MNVIDQKHKSNRVMKLTMLPNDVGGEETKSVKCCKFLGKKKSPRGFVLKVR